MGGGDRRPPSGQLKATGHQAVASLTLEETVAV
jgi:hypothetical protein